VTELLQRCRCRRIRGLADGVSPLVLSTYVGVVAGAADHRVVCLPPRSKPPLPAPPVSVWTALLPVSALVSALPAPLIAVDAGQRQPFSTFAPRVWLTHAWTEVGPFVERLR
jgi:hypothetical protein